MSPQMGCVHFNVINYHNLKFVETCREKQTTSEITKLFYAAKLYGAFKPLSAEMWGTKRRLKSELQNESGVRDPVGYLREESSLSSIQASFPRSSQALKRFTHMAECELISYFLFYSFDNSV